MKDMIRFAFLCFCSATVVSLSLSVCAFGMSIRGAVQCCGISVEIEWKCRMWHTAADDGGGTGGNREQLEISWHCARCNGFGSGSNDKKDHII